MVRWFAILLFGACARAPAAIPPQPVPEGTPRDAPKPRPAPEVLGPVVKVDGVDELRAALGDQAAPPVVELTVRNIDRELCERPEALFELLAAPGRLAHLRSLVLGLPDCFPPEALAGLEQLPLPALRSLGLRSLGPRGAEVLAALPLLARLERLDLADCALGRAGVVALAHSPHLRGLQDLSLAGALEAHGALARPGDAGLVLADTPAWVGLRSLDLSFNNLERAALAGLGGNPALARLAELDVSYVKGADDDRYSALVRAGGLPGLTVLHIGDSETRDKGIVALAEARRWPGLRELYIPDELGSEDTRALARAMHLTALERLYVRIEPAARGAARALGKARQLAGLRELDISFSGLTEQTMVDLVGTLRSPERLMFMDNHVGDAGARAIAARRDWTRLRTLDLYGAGVSDGGAVALAAAPQLASLEELTLVDNKIGERGWRALVGSTSLARLVDDGWRHALALRDRTLSPADAARSIPRDLKVTLSRPQCFGKCPVFSVTLRSGGRVVYRGERFVTRAGRAVARVDRSIVRLVLASLDAFEATAPERHPNDATCKIFMTDMPGVVLAVRRGGRTRTYRISSLCPRSPPWEGLYDLADRIDALLDTDRWTYVVDP